MTIKDKASVRSFGPEPRQMRLEAAKHMTSDEDGTCFFCILYVAEECSERRSLILHTSESVARNNSETYPPSICEVIYVWSQSVPGRLLASHGKAGALLSVERGA